MSCVFLLRVIGIDAYSWSSSQSDLVNGTRGENVKAFSFDIEHTFVPFVR